jgi:hypothetical protein
MTTSTNPELALTVAERATRDQMNTLLGALADAGEALDRSASGTDIIDVVIALRPFMAPTAWASVADAWELCPTHACDERICADDEADCEAGQA